MQQQITNPAQNKKTSSRIAHLPRFVFVSFSAFTFVFVSLFSFLFYTVCNGNHMISSAIWDKSAQANFSKT